MLHAFTFRYRNVNDYAKRTEPILNALVEELQSGSQDSEAVIFAEQLGVQNRTLGDVERAYLAVAISFTLGYCDGEAEAEASRKAGGA